ncbi:DUF6174 domain-containing protein [Deinococcus sp.]|uniref:DUF6174 domain-containing protein n=1 Tax=Deinococcus sp. TaxID=47478 RepID=UPI0025E7F0FE|nr:DUF6174 domain-containing protein [Deinococcus sp.]
MKATPCQPSYIQPDIVALNSKLAAARQRWKSAGIQTYSYQIFRSAPPGPFLSAKITVTDSKVSRVEKAAYYPANIIIEEGKTIDDHFGDIEQDIAWVQTAPCPFLDVDYDCGL